VWPMKGCVQRIAIHDGDHCAVTLTVTFASQTISRLVLTELRAAACASWQGVTQVPVRFHLEQTTHPVKYRRVIVNAALMSIEQSAAADQPQQAWLNAKL